ncbi:glutathione ABC transporter substrate-binding protein [Natribacillus halophilus]|uniref:Peptide/nickel transport system substrate-binding protein n=1 Tax=Natribacillus halophilus TaxID=549003 RepID=A0A1G8LEY2_9BACI|nr:glutathione ABC transporter substrate-binding protein [Natribacillus halophilus]SDI54221.1 peptide/nickel transport system substrate-binding protein [Natribacillus halophilus]
MKRYKRSGYIVGVTLAASLVLAACTDDSDVEEGAEADESEEEAEEEDDEDDGDSDGGEEADGEPQEGGDFLISMSGEPVSMDPHASNDNQSAKARTLMYETLLNHNSDTLDLETTGLAESYEQTDDDTWVFELHEGVHFHNGEELTADDVAATFDRVLEEDRGSEAAFLFEMIESTEAVDDYTVEITTEFPFAPLPAHLAHNAAGIMSEAAIEEDEAGDINLEIEGVGTGPFIFEEWNQGDSLTVTKNEDYWGEEAYLDSVTFEIVGEDLTRVSMLENNETHVADLIQPNLVEQVEALDNAHLIAEPSLSLTYVGFNTEKEPFDDVRVRQAISLAVDNELLVDGVYDGYGEAAYGPINELVFGYDDDLEDIGYDPEEAEELLAEAGYEDGFETTLWMNDDNPVREQTSELIQDQLADIGVDVSLENVEWGAYLDQTAEGEHDMFVLGWVTVTGDADYGMYSLFHSDNFGAPGNRSFYENEEVDDLLDEAREEEDEETREELYSEIQQILVDEAPMIYTVFDELRVGVADSAENFIQHPNGTWDLSETYITEEAEVDGY